MKLLSLSITLFLAVTFVTEKSYSQVSTDSLISVILDNDQADTVKINSCFQYLSNYTMIAVDTAGLVAAYMVELAKKNEDANWLFKAYDKKGLFHFMLNQFTESLECFQLALVVAEKENDLKGQARMYRSMSSIYYTEIDFEKAEELLIKAIKIFEKIGEEQEVAATKIRLGNAYQNDLKYEQAELAFDEAMNYYLQIKDSMFIAHIQLGKGYLYVEQKRFDEALVMLLESAETFNRLNNTDGFLGASGSVSEIYFRQNKFNESLEWADKCEERITEHSHLGHSRQIAWCRYYSYKGLGDYEKALNEFERYYMLRDSIANSEIQRDIIEKEVGFGYEKQKVIAEKENEKKLAVAAEREYQNKLIIASVIGGLILVLVFAFFVVNRLRLSNRQKRIINYQKNKAEQQKRIVENQHKEIKDSINYAKRIQDAILPPKKFIQKYLPDSFVLYKPKDIVAGDFYWMEQTDYGIILAVADCTGHGVPGAMVSVVCHNALNRSVREFGLIDPGQILDKTRNLVIETFEKSESEVKDGMDIALVLIDKKKCKLLYAGANNSIYRITKENEQCELIETKSDKQPIGKFATGKPFSTSTFDFNSGDTIYLFTDGYADQFGGEKGKKLKYSAFKEILLGIQSMSISEQGLALEESFFSWKGNLDQLDDVCVIGVQL